MMIRMIKDHHHRSNLKIKKLYKDRGQGSWIKGSGAKPSKKGGSGGGSQKSPNFAHGGGNLGGVFLGGPGKQGS